MKHFGIILLLAIVAGALAGIIATVFTNDSLNRYAQSLADQERLFVISEEKPRPLPGTYEEALAQVQEVGWPATAIIREASVDSNIASGWFTDESASGVGTVITSDGWILFHADALNEFSQPEVQAEVWVQNERFVVEQVIQDTKTDFALVKVDAQSLSTLAFGPSASMLGGDLLFIIPSTSEIVPSSLKDSDESVDGLVLRAEDFSSEWEMTDGFDSPAPVLNAAGELVAFVRTGEFSTPLHHVRAFIQSTLRNGEVQHVGIGAYVAMIDDALNIDPVIAEQTRFGALVTSPDARTAAVVPGSPAALAGIQAGDIIVSVDDVLVDEQTDLAELLSVYEVGQSAQIQIIRGAEEVEVTVEFAELSEVY